MSTILTFEDDFLAILGGQVAPDGPPGLIGSPPAGDSVIWHPEHCQSKGRPLSGQFWGHSGIAWGRGYGPASGLYRLAHPHPDP